MAGKPFVVVWAAQDSEAALKEQYRAEAHGKLRVRLHGLWLLRQGQPVDEVAAVVGVGRRTVERWVDWYRHEGGVVGVRAHHQGGVGRIPRLSAEQQEEVGQEVATGRFRTAAEIGRWITDTYGVTYRPGGVTALLGRLRCHPKVPRPLHEKADPQAQEAWKKGGLPQPERRRG